MAYKKTVDGYLTKSGDWQAALEFLREILLESRLEETVKWGAPTYVLGKKNVIGLGAFKSYVGIWFFQGALLKDAQQKLLNAQEGKTQAMRQWRFQSLEEIQAEQETISAYIEEAITNQEEGREIKPNKKKPLEIPEELSAQLSADPALNAAFEVLSLGKKREYAEYISEAKRAATKQKRMEKILPMIQEGIGLNDKYR